MVFLAIYSTSFALSADFGTMAAYEWLPLVGSFLGTIAIFITKMSVTKTLAITSAMAWSGYYAFSGLNTQLIGEFFTVAANIVALTMLMIAARKGIPEYAIRDIDDRLAEALTGSIHVVTESVRTVTQSNRIIGTHTRPIRTFK